MYTEVLVQECNGKVCLSLVVTSPEAEGSSRVALGLAVGIGNHTLDRQGAVAEVTFDCGHFQNDWALTRLCRGRRREVVTGISWQCEAQCHA